MRNEAQTRADLIDPLLIAAGWTKAPLAKLLYEHKITNGDIQSGGSSALKADYALRYQGRLLAVIEAKAETLSAAQGVAQAKHYAGLLGARFAFATNGKTIYQIDMATGAEGQIDAWPDPAALWSLADPKPNPWRDAFSAIPFHDGGKGWTPRYHQERAITAALDAIADGKKRVLLTLATGTGKTAIAFQIAWRLFQTRWTLEGDKARRPRILFLADRNILADQAYNAFSAFSAARARIDPAEIRKKGKAPQNAAVFFTIFQTFMTQEGDNPEEAKRVFEAYAPDFFDLVIIDECHRGGAQDESEWRGILEHFAPAVQLGLTATPKRDANVDTYAYFGDPVYQYSLRQGIDDGFLTPFRLRQIESTLDEYAYDPDDDVEEGGAPAEGQIFTESDFNRKIQIEERERHRVKFFLGEIKPHEKTMVFCATQDHAALVRDLINQEKTASKHPDYCMRVTADDGKFGDTALEAFKNPEKVIPMILTTSRKLSTGVDAPDLRNIVLMRPVKSMIEFKQIIGRGTRLYEGKTHFTIFDFVKAHERFNDPEWDGEPLEAVKTREGAAPSEGEPTPPDEEHEGPKILKIRLADGKEREIKSIAATSFMLNGKLVSAQGYLEALYGALPEFFKDENDLRALWSDPDTRATLLEGLKERGFGRETLQELAKDINAQDSDLFDVLAYIAFVAPPMARKERAAFARADLIRSYDDKMAAFLEFILEQYEKTGEQELGVDRLSKALELKYSGVPEGIKFLQKAPNEIRKNYLSMQKRIYDARKLP